MTEAAAPPGYPPLPADPAGPAPRISRWAEAAVALAVLVVVGLLGFPLGWLWQHIAPHTPAVRQPDGAFLTDAEGGEQRIADEGWYLLLMVGAGLLLAILVWLLLRRYRGPVLTVALTLGALACGIITWKFGHHFGYAHARALIDAPTWTGSTNFTLPVDLRAARIGLWHGWLPFARGDVLAMPITALLVYVLCAGFSPYPALRATHRYPEPTFTGLVPGAEPQPYGPAQPYAAHQPTLGPPADGAPSGRPAPPYSDLLPGTASAPSPDPAAQPPHSPTS